jgi:hypothetical protein
METLSVAKDTKAFLQYGEHAFTHVVQLLDEQRQLRRLQGGGRLLVAAAKETVTNNTNTNTTSTTTPTPSTSTMEDYYLPPPSVGVDSMDHEHQAYARQR